MNEPLQMRIPRDVWLKWLKESKPLPPQKVSFKEVFARCKLAVPYQPPTDLRKAADINPSQSPQS